MLNTEKNIMSTISLIFLMSLILFSSCTSDANKASHKQPNIVFIIGDDVGCYDLGCYGNKGIKTPFIDRMASEGMRFNNTFLTTSSCSPSRVSIITGRYPHNTGACELHSPLPANQRLFPEILKKGGYYTAQAAGKWHFGTTPVIHSKSEFDQLDPAVRAFDRISAIGEENGNGGEGMWIKTLQERPIDKPFFMWFAAYDSHRTWGADDFSVQNSPDNV